MHHLGVVLLVVLAVLVLGPTLGPAISSALSGLLGLLSALPLPKLAAPSGVVVWLLLGLVVVGVVKLVVGV